MSLSRLVETAKAALRPDLAAEIERLGHHLTEAQMVTQLARATAATQHHGWQSHTNQAVEIERWDLPRRPVWLVTIGTGGLDGGEGWAYEELILTEYDVTDEQVAAAVIEVLRWETRFTSEWAGRSTQYRLRPDYADRLSERRDALANGMHRWVDAVTALRALDPQPAPPPTKGGREL